MVERLKTVAVGNGVLEGFEGFVFKFDDFAAIEADQVIMVVPFGGGFVAGFTVSKFSWRREPQSSQELQGAVDRGITNLGIDFCHLGVDLGEVLMPRRLKKDVEDLLPLPRPLQSPS